MQIFDFCGTVDVGYELMLMANGDKSVPFKVTEVEEDEGRTVATGLAFFGKPEERTAKLTLVRGWDDCDIPHIDPIGDLELLP